MAKKVILLLLNLVSYPSISVGAVVCGVGNPCAKNCPNRILNLRGFFYTQFSIIEPQYPFCFPLLFRCILFAQLTSFKPRHRHFQFFFGMRGSDNKIY